MTLTYHTERGRSEEETKSGLFCLTCNHESPIDGDWIADDSVPGNRLLCPKCGDIVVDQPRL